MSNKMFPTLFAGVLLSTVAGCANTHGAPASDAQAAAVVRFTWNATWGPCMAADMPCQESFVVTPDGGVKHTLKDTPSMATLNATDLAALGTFLRDPGLATAISDPAPCSSSQTQDRAEVVLLDFSGEHTAASKSVFGCVGAPYDQIGQWITKLRSYFP